MRGTGLPARKCMPRPSEPSWLKVKLCIPSSENIATNGSHVGAAPPVTRTPMAA